MSYLQTGTKAALEVMEDGGIVYTHCSRGRHRGPAMGACILIARGMDAEEALGLIKQQRPISDPFVWYLKSRVLKFAREWNGTR